MYQLVIIDSTQNNFTLKAALFVILPVVMIKEKRRQTFFSALIDVSLYTGY